MDETKTSYWSWLYMFTMLQITYMWLPVNELLVKLPRFLSTNWFNERVSSNLLLVFTKPLLLHTQDFHQAVTLPAFTSGPVCRDFPRQSHSVDARRDFSRWSHQTSWVRGRKSDLGLVINIAQLFSSNVRMRELWWHGDLTHSQFAQQKPLNRDCPRKAGACDDSVDGRS